MKIDKFWNGLKRISDDGEYVLEGDLVSEETIEIVLDNCFVVKGRIESKESIIVRCGIEAGEGIKAGKGIKAGWGIKAGKSINAGGGISAGDDINAGESINAGDDINAGESINARTFIDCQKRIFAGLSVFHASKNCVKTIECENLKNGEICFGDLVIVK